MKYILLGIIIALFSFIVGFAVGVDTAVTKGAGLASALMDSGHLNISYDRELIETIMNRYVNSAKLN